MRLNDERALYGLADDDDRPDPANARTAAEFVALLGALVEQSGLSLPEIEELAGSKGYVLPEQIIATVLSHDALPPEELVVALVRSIGINDREVKYWVEVLWRLESRPTYNPAQTDQGHERKPPRDIEQIYGTKDEPGPSEPYVVSAAFEAGRLPMPGIDPYLDPPGSAGSVAMGEQPHVAPDADEVYDEVYEEQHAAPMFYEAGQVPDADEDYELPQPYGAGQGPAVGEGYGEGYEAGSYPGEPPHGMATGYETVEYDEPYVEAEPVGPAASWDYSEGPRMHAVSERGERSSWTGAPRHARDDDEDDDGDRRDDPQFMEHYETRDVWPVRPERPRIRELATRSIRRVNRKARWPLPVAVGLSVVLVISLVAWMAFGGNGGGGAPSNAAPPGSSQNQTGAGSKGTGGSVSPTASDGSVPSLAAEVVPGNAPNQPANPNNPNNPNIPNPQQTTQGPQTTPTQPRTYNTQLAGTGSTTCTNEGGQWRVRILVNVTVTDPPPGLSPQGQGGLSGSMQGFSLSGGGSSYSGSTTVTVGPAPAPNVGTVQWVVTMSVPGGRTARDESFEGYSCA